jgi:hypothetical protein
MNLTSNLAYFVFQPGLPPNRRREFCERLRKGIVRDGRQREFPIIRYEPGREVSCYVGVGAEIGMFASGKEEAERQLGQLVQQVEPRMARWKPYYITGFTQLRGLLPNPVGCEGFTTSLVFERVEIGIASSTHLRQSLDDPSAVEVEIPNPLSAEHDRLLYWCSCNGSGDLARLIEAAQLLGTLPGASRPWSMLRRMVLLGHIEVARTPAGWRWSIAPPIRLTPATGGMPFLAGLRLPSDLDDDNVVCEPQNLGPAVVSCSTWTGAYSSSRIADALPELDQFVSSASTWNETDFHDYRIQRTDDDGHREHIVAPDDEPDGVHIFERDDGVVHAWFDRPRLRWIASDPLTILFLHRATAGLAAAAIGEDGSFVVPWTDRWPIPYERALVLASGQLPRLVRDGDGALLLKYKDIPRELATQVAGKLNVHLGGRNA